MNVAEKMEGVVKMWGDKGYGFIAAGGCDYFTHFKDVVTSGSMGDDQTFIKLTKGQKVSFEPGEGRKGPIATKVRVL